jgi:hypothetical protein
VWATVSVFIHVTVSPTATPTSSGENARFASVDAPMGIVTADEGPPVAGGVAGGVDGGVDGVGDEGDDE